MLLLLFLKEFGILNGGRREQEECLFLTLENEVILHDFFPHFFFFLFFWVDIKIAVMVMPDRGVETRSTQIKYGGTRFFLCKRRRFRRLCRRTKFPDILCKIS